MYGIQAKITLALVVVAVLSMGCAKQENSETILPQLTGNVWVAEYILGKPVIDMTHSSIEFGEDGTVRGLAGCNSYHGSYTLNGSVVAFGPMAATMRACVDAISDQEMRFFQSLTQPQTVKFKDGLLLLIAEDGKISKFATQN
ncbi:META domain-containing protein [uncultured Pseudodesulfovibrio sp.]|uniref:META domain-containing protein n=1 Tax=uncultured Pseudodesulfovibrio sp. TaxID=2035858 RepID=UPI0029C94E48|nr:META domain-containing protein [uncultured Pseudodesulfovibrio sp.]